MIGFPNLFGGISLTMQRVAFHIGTLPIYWYGIIISCAFIAAIALALKASKKYDIDPNDLIDIALFSTVAAIIGARAYYVIFSLNEFEGNLLNIFNPRTGGLAIYGGIIGAFIAVFFVCRFKKISFLKILDFGVPYLVLGQAIGRWGNFFNQEAFGTNTNLPWGMTGDHIAEQLTTLQQSGVNISPNLPVHPTFLYESLACFLIFGALMYFRKKSKTKGFVLALYLMLYGLERFFIEGLRTDSLMIFGFRVSQVLSAVMVLAAAAFFAFKIIKKIKLKNPKEPVVEKEYISVLEELLDLKKQKEESKEKMLDQLIDKSKDKRKK